MFCIHSYLISDNRRVSADKGTEFYRTTCKKSSKKYTLPGK